MNFPLNVIFMSEYMVNPTHMYRSECRDLCSSNGNTLGKLLSNLYIHRATSILVADVCQNVLERKFVGDFEMLLTVWPLSSPTSSFSWNFNIEILSETSTCYPSGSSNVVEKCNL